MAHLQSGNSGKVLASSSSSSSASVDGSATLASSHNETTLHVNNNGSATNHLPDDTNGHSSVQQSSNNVGSSLYSGYSNGSSSASSSTMNGSRQVGSSPYNGVLASHSSSNGHLEKEKKIDSPSHQSHALLLNHDLLAHHSTLQIVADTNTETKLVSRNGQKLNSSSSSPVTSAKRTSASPNRISKSKSKGSNKNRNRVVENRISRSIMTVKASQRYRKVIYTCFSIL